MCMHFCVPSPAQSVLGWQCHPSHPRNIPWEWFMLLAFWHTNDEPILTNRNLLLPGSFVPFHHMTLLSLNRTLSFRLHKMPAQTMTLYCRCRFCQNSEQATLAKLWIRCSIISTPQFFLFAESILKPFLKPSPRNCGTECIKTFVHLQI